MYTVSIESCVMNSRSELRHLHGTMLFSYTSTITAVMRMELWASTAAGPGRQPCTSTFLELEGPPWHRRAHSREHAQESMLSESRVRQMKATKSVSTPGSSTCNGGTSRRERAATARVRAPPKRRTPPVGHRLCATSVHHPLSTFDGARREAPARRNTGRRLQKTSRVGLRLPARTWRPCCWRSACR